MDLEKAQNTIVDFIRNKVNEAGVSGAVVGVSGGIDSALSATLAVKALGPENVLGIHLPEIGLTPETEGRDAKALAEWLGIELRTIDISGVLASIMSVIPKSETADRLTQGNLKARVRMSLLYFHANQLNKLVLGTGNKTEILIGYYTKYGDGGVDIEPIGELYKTDVWELSRRLGVPESIVNKKPTAGLWSGQTDEADLGISYEKLDRVLRLLEDRCGPEDIMKEIGVSEEQLHSIQQRIRKNMHKRTIPPAAPLF